MTPALSPNTQAILLLTAPLIAGRAQQSPDLLSPGEYKRLARHLRERQQQPSDLLATDAAELRRACKPVVDEGRLQRLLGRGFLLSQVIERWQARAIWVVSRADPDYPHRLRARLREDSPAVIYGCGDMTLLDSGGLAVVGSRHVDESLIDYTMAVGHLAARAGRTLVSGGARGIDQAAMRGALEAGGKVSGVLTDSLEKTTMNREHRNLLLDGRLVLISPYDPSAGFNVGNAMQRNKLIYALADASLIVSSDLNKGGTWSGAVEQLDKLKFAPVYVRSTGERSPGLDALHIKGALPWPNPSNVDELESVFDVSTPTITASSPSGLGLFERGFPSDTTLTPVGAPTDLPAAQNTKERSTLGVPEKELPTIPEANDELSPEVEDANAQVTRAPAASVQPMAKDLTPAEALFDAVRDSMRGLLRAPMKDAEIAAALDVSTAQAKKWLQRLVDEGVLEKRRKPVGYAIKQNGLFE